MNSLLSIQFSNQQGTYHIQSNEHIKLLLQILSISKLLKNKYTPQFLLQSWTWVLQQWFT